MLPFPTTVELNGFLKRNGSDRVATALVRVALQYLLTCIYTWELLTRSLGDIWGAEDFVFDLLKI